MEKAEREKEKKKDFSSDVTEWKVKCCFCLAGVGKLLY